MEQKCGIPRVRPPFPVTSGYLNQPTVVNNVETLAAAEQAASDHAAREKGLRGFPLPGVGGQGGDLPANRGQFKSIGRQVIEHKNFKDWQDGGHNGSARVVLEDVDPSEARQDVGRRGLDLGPGRVETGVVKVNDTYFNTPTYGSDAWRIFVMCQEVGHTFGLGHQDETFGNVNLGSCMDYTSDPTSNQHPNQHDYDMLTEIYAHLNGTSDGGSKPGKGKNGKGKPAGVGVDVDLNNPSAWGQAVRQDAQGKNSLFERDLGNGQVLITHVIWVR